MPADLRKPFDPACCEGSTCSDGSLSALSCGCDPGLLKNGKVIGHLCERHAAVDSYVKQYGLPQESHEG